MSNIRFRNLPTGTKAYVYVVVGAGAATVIQSFYDLASKPIGWNWAILAILTLVSGSATVRLPSLPATISVSETFVFTSVLLFGSAAGTITVALDALVISFWSYRKGHPTYKILFNVCALPLTIWVASHVFFLFPNIEPMVTASRDETVRIGELVGPLLVFTILYFSLNSWIITFAISLERKLNAFAIWRDHFLWLSLNYFGGASVAALLVSYTHDLDFTYLAVIVPLLVVLYFTFSMSMGRIEDANRHLTQLNALYMSTIETLAMAIDAKDQITHGHIRRVQAYAVSLAKHVGLTDTSLIRAVEAAALLHDMGKLAVPEYILNKPGPLTPTEFDKMKLHASVGADILSAIDFPYPVVPIVRHHHENWDGTGYPDGLAGTNIPIGARILAVVDCFDALTSDRPYRPRLSDKDALRILMDRRGIMYDPLVVDTFIRVHPMLVAESADLAGDASLAAIAGASGHQPQSRSLDEIAGSAEETLTLFELARALTSPKDFSEVADVMSKHLRRLVPSSVCVIFLHDIEAGELVAAHSSGDNASFVSGLRIGLGQRLSGWVAAHRQTIRNSDPVLDLGDAARGIEPRPRSCLSTPLQFDNELIGVLTLYSTAPNAFTDEHQRLIEAVSKQVSPIVQHFVPMRGSHRDVAVALPGLEHLLRLMQAIGGQGLPTPTSLLLVEISSADNRRRHAQDANESLLRAVANIAQRNLRTSDLIFRHGPGELLILLLKTDLLEATSIGGRIQQATGDDKRVAVVQVKAALITASSEQDKPMLELIHQTIARARDRRADDSKSELPRGSIH